jgi:hypothetical protein
LLRRCRVRTLLESGVVALRRSICIFIVSPSSTSALGLTLIMTSVSGRSSLVAEVWIVILGGHVDIDLASFGISNGIGARGGLQRE